MQGLTPTEQFLLLRAGRNLKPGHILHLTEMGSHLCTCLCMLLQKNTVVAHGLGPNRRTWRPALDDLAVSRAD